MAYVKNTWVDQDVERPKTYEVTNNQDGSITLTDSFGLVTELGTPVNEVNMNHIEDGIDGCAIRKHNLTETFNLGEWVLGGTGDDEGIYKSLIDNNVGNAITDDTKWEKVEMGGSSRNIGEIVASTIPLTDAGLHLLDGALLQYGSYQAFIDYIADLYDSGDYTAIFDTEANWQSAVTTYGVCGKFVYDSVNNTVRLPKYSNKIYTSTIEQDTAPVIGNGIAIGLDSGTTTGYGLHSDSSSGNLGVYSGVYGQNVGTQSVTGALKGYNLGLSKDGTKSGIIAQLSDITTSLEGYYYIVVATSTKTAIQVDIDEIATDLNGKADVDLTNVNDTATSTGASWSMPSDTYDDLTLGASGATYTAPANGYFVLAKVSGISNGTITFVNARTTGDTSLGGNLSARFISPTTTMTIYGYIPAKKNDVVTVAYTATGTTDAFRFIYAKGSESEAS